ncbi:hypothetical protein JRQ81_015017 [Phrynocephalus forsythii]|uniref:L1 transposable element RRM domain-containing protein n=1 Tax=Phrynocephalus forsythii TaxID=171643 RepID=A0A9Q1B3D2_9SAUR|nr:hypothetical protein JRQ81_015017 [Phrynocephalus forsythii]
MATRAKGGVGKSSPVLESSIGKLVSQESQVISMQNMVGKMLASIQTQQNVMQVQQNNFFEHQEQQNKKWEARLERLEKMDDMKLECMNLHEYKKDMEKELIELKQDMQKSLLVSKKMEKETEETKQIIRNMERQKNRKILTLCTFNLKCKFSLEITKCPRPEGTRCVFFPVRILTGWTGLGKEEIESNIDIEMQFPRELQIRFLKSGFRNKALKAIQGKTFIKYGKNIKALNHVPWKIRQLRKQYEKLTKTLRRKDISYRWLFPEGVTFEFAGQRHYVNSTMKAEQILKRLCEDEDQEEDEEHEKDEENLQPEESGEEEEQG